MTWYDDVLNGRATSMREIAGGERVGERYVAQLLPLALLSPSLVEGCTSGARELSIEVPNLAKGVTFPAAWETQAAQFVAT